MSLRNITLVNKFTKQTGTCALILCSLAQSPHANALDIDFSHHQMTREPTTVAPAETVTPQSPPAEAVEYFKPPVASESTMMPALPVQTVVSQNELVILNTEAGFVPKSLALRAGVTYTIHVINVNEKLKNVSFVMDSFNQFQSTYFNELKTFKVTPTTEGSYTYQCPEMNFEGHAVVVGNVLSPESTAPAETILKPVELNHVSIIKAQPNTREPAMTEEAAPEMGQESSKAPPIRRANTSLPVERVPSAKTVGQTIDPDAATDDSGSLNAVPQVPAQKSTGAASE